MGRFETLEDAHRALQLRRTDGIPGFFKVGWAQRIASALTAEQMVVYQPFVPPEPHNGLARKYRINLFISPLFNSYLSAHGVISRSALPQQLPLGLVPDVHPFMISVSHGATFERLEPHVEFELDGFARDFGIVAGRAIEERFETAPAPRVSPMDHHHKARYGT